MGELAVAEGGEHSAGDLLARERRAAALGPERRGVDLEINWVGRMSVWLTMGGIFLALVTGAWISTAVFGVGLAGSLLASALYVNTALRQAPES